MKKSKIESAIATLREAVADYNVGRRDDQGCLIIHSSSVCLVWSSNMAEIEAEDLVHAGHDLGTKVSVVDKLMESTS